METNYYNIIDTKRETLKDERAIVHYISTPDIDRMNEVVNPIGMTADDFQKSPTVFYNHNYNLPIAKNLWLKRKESGVLAKTQFSKTEFANDIYTLHEEGIINTWSIGFIPDEKSIETNEKTGRRIIQKWNLIEYSSAPLPANPNALDVAKTLCKSFEMKNNLKEFENYINILNQLSEYQKEINDIKKLYEELKNNNSEILNEITFLKSQLKTSVENAGYSPEQLELAISKAISGAFSKVTGRKFN